MKSSTSLYLDVAVTCFKKVTLDNGMVMIRGERGTGHLTPLATSGPATAGQPNLWFPRWWNPTFSANTSVFSAPRRFDSSNN
jgi:hypothetical protein